jgi:hypothetical protein
MLVAFAKNQTLVAEYDAGAVLVYTDPQPMGGANWAQAVVNTEVLFKTGAGAFTFQIDGEGSNDGQYWVAISDMSLPITAIGQTSDGCDVTWAFIRFKIALSVTGASGNIAVATFDLHVNLIHK